MAKVEIFTGPNCGYCERAKALLNERNIVYQELDISEEKNLAMFAERLPRLKTIPQIFINDEHIGGEEDLAIIAADGRLDQMLSGESS